MIQLNLHFTHACRHTDVLACLKHAELQKLAYYSIAHNFVCRPVNTHNTLEVHVMSLPHYICAVATGTVAVATGTVAVGNEIELCCS